MRKIIIAMPNCQKCEMLKTQFPEAETVVAQPDELLQFARLSKIQSMPFVVCVGEPHELSEILK